MIAEVQLSIPQLGNPESNKPPIAEVLYGHVDKAKALITGRRTGEIDAGDEGHTGVSLPGGVRLTL